MRKFIAIVAALATILYTTPASADSDDLELGDDLEVAEELIDAVEVRGIRRHQRAFQRFADRGDGTRVGGSVGYDLSADYIERKMRRAGYDVERLEFEFPFFQEVGAPTFSQDSPDAVTYVDGTDFDVMTFSGSGTVSSVDVTAVDLSLDDRAASTSGCETEDFAGFPAGTIALMQRGACSFALKATNAEAAGAVGAIIFNQGNTPDREGLLFGTLGGPGAGIPVVGTTFAVGEALAGGATASLDVNTLSEIRTTTNVVAQSRTGDPDNVVMLGAHLDSVPEGPGVQDNGSGSAAILEIALQLADEFDVNEVDDDDDDDDERDEDELVNAVRFAWWGAEEFGLLGSIDYVVNLTDEELAQIGVYLNFDMIGSPNFVRFVYDSDGSDIAPTIAVPPESARIEQVFLDFFASQGLATEPTVIGQRSDHFAFCVSGIPCGGLFTGAEGIKTEAEQAIYGGTAGEQYDQCYHLACDTFRNISRTALDQMSAAAAYATAVFAFDLPSTPAGDDDLNGDANGTGGGGHTPHVPDHE